MRKLSKWSGLSASERGASVAIGNFDGVHLGHQKVLELAQQKAGPHRPWGVVTFEPHAREYFVPGCPPFRLMNPEARANRLQRLGVEVLYELPFNAEMAALSPEEFVRQVLAEGLGVRHVVVGADFRFGKGRAGSAQDLARLSEAVGIEVTVAALARQDGSAQPLTSGDDPAKDISSTAIRQLLGEGRPREAAAMLGHWHRIEGPVIQGDQRGRDLGFPTANMSIKGLRPPRFGIYAVFADVLTGPHRGSYLGASNIGTRPMFGENIPNLETYLFDFSGDLYGEHLSVALVEFLRPEAKFASLDALIAQMDQDCQSAREILTAELAKASFGEAEGRCTDPSDGSSDQAGEGAA